MHEIKIFQFLNFQLYHLSSLFLQGVRFNWIIFVESFKQARGIALTIWFNCPLTDIFAVNTESQCIFLSNISSITSVLQLGVLAKLYCGGSGTVIIVSQLKLNPSAATFKSETNTIVTHPLDVIRGGVFTPENGPAKIGDAVFGPS